MNKTITENDNDKILFLYTLAEISYKKHFNNQEGIFPEGWYESKRYEEKIKILSEAIETNTLIVNTLGYQSFIECIKVNNKNSRLNS